MQFGIVGVVVVGEVVRLGVGVVGIGMKGV